MLLPRFVVLIVSAGMMVLGSSVVSGQNYPNKPIRIATGEPAGSADFAARLIAAGLSGSLGQQAIVDNRGGSVAIPAAIVSKATPDGYTLLIIGSSVWTFPLLQGKADYDPVKDFSPITLATSSPTIIVVHPSVPVNSVKELIAYAKSRQGELNYASGITGSSSHLAAELFKAMAGVNIVRIFYKGGGPALNDLLAGRVQLMFPNTASVTPHLKSGRLKALAVTSAQPSALAPGLPTAASSGLPGYSAVSVNAVFAPANTRATIINLLNRKIVEYLNTPETQERLLNSGVEAVGSSAQELTASIKSEMTNLLKVIKNTGIRSD